MFCINCGQELPDNAKFCNHCGNPINILIENNTSSETKIVIDQEMVLEKGRCNWCKNLFYVENGHCVLTTKRFVYSTHSILKIAMIGALAAFTDSDCEFSILIDDIASVTTGRHGLGRVMLITTNSNEEYKFWVPQKIQDRLTNLVEQ